MCTNCTKADMHSIYVEKSLIFSFLKLNPQSDPTLLNKILVLQIHFNKFNLHYLKLLSLSFLLFKRNGFSSEDTFIFIYFYLKIYPPFFPL